MLLFFNKTKRKKYTDLISVTTQSYSDGRLHKRDKTSVPRHILSTLKGCLYSISPCGQNMPQLIKFCLEVQSLLLGYLRI